MSERMTNKANARTKKKRRNNRTYEQTNREQTSKPICTRPTNEQANRRMNE